MRFTEHTIQPEVLEYQPVDVTSKMEHSFREMYDILYNTLNQYNDAKWYNRSRSRRMISENRLFYPYGDEYLIELIPKSLYTYAREGLKAHDIVIIWSSEYDFLPITFKQFNEIYDQEVDKIWDSEYESNGLSQMVINRLNEMVGKEDKVC